MGVTRSPWRSNGRTFGMWRRIGVSLTTVSLIINKNDQRISEPRVSVLDAIELSYTVPSRARLADRRANTLAILVPQLQNAFADVYFGGDLRHLRRGRRTSFRILLEVARRDYIKRREYMQLLEDCSVDGIFFLGATEEHKFLKSSTRLIVRFWSSTTTSRSGTCITSYATTPRPVRMPRIT